jgi:hypothetical protein
MLFVIAMFLGAAAGTAQTSPPSPSAEKVYGSLGEIKTAGYVVRLSSSPAPPIRGVNSFEVQITDASGKMIDDAKATFDLNMTNMNHGKNIVGATPFGGGRYRGEVRFMMPGPWRAIVRIERPGNPAVDLRFDFKVNFK